MNDDLKELEMIEFISSEVFTEEDIKNLSDSLTYCFHNYGFHKGVLSKLQSYYKKAWESEKEREEKTYTLFMPETNELLSELKNKIISQKLKTENAESIIKNIESLCNQMLLPKEEKHETFTPAEIAVMAEYPAFKKDYQTLINNKYMSKNGDYLTWNKSKQSLAEYFGKQAKEDTNVSWKPIETLFNQKNLSSAFSQNGNAIKKKLSKDYEALLKILK